MLKPNIIDQFNSVMNSKRAILIVLLFINVGLFLWHIFLHCNPPYISYFSQVTVLGQTMLVANFVLAVVHFHQHKYSKLHSRFYIINFSIETVAVLGFWALRIFFTEGIIDPDEKRDFLVEALSLWMHGGSYLTLLYIGRLWKVQLEFGLRKKMFLHFCWGIIYIFIQYWHFRTLSKHIYSFLELFDWSALIAFELILYGLSILSDYFLTFAIEHKQHVLLDEVEKKKTDSSPDDSKDRQKSKGKRN